MNEVTSGFLSPGLGAASPAPRDSVTSGTHDTGSRDPPHTRHSPNTPRGKVATEKYFMGAKNICCPQLATVASVTGLVTGGWGPVAGAYI